MTHMKTMKIMMTINLGRSKKKGSMKQEESTSSKTTKPST